MVERVTILGAGSWGMAIARLLDGNGADVRLWEFDPAECKKLLKHRTIPEKLNDMEEFKGITPGASTRISNRHSDSGSITIVP